MESIPGAETSKPDLAPKVQEEVMDYNWRYSSFSELKPMFFSEAVNLVDGCIDLLHADGTHIYADVKTDFESWLTIAL